MDFTCDKCKKNCNTAQGLQWHLDSKNSCSVSLKCDKCDFVAANKSSLQRHINKKIPCNQIFKCEQCQYIAPNKTALNNHLNRKTQCKSPEIITTPVITDIFNNDINILLENEELLNINQVLDKINYKANKQYLDKFLPSIQNNKMIYLDTDLVNILNSQEITKLLSKYFSINKHYIINNKDISIYPESFKELCFYINTNESRELKQYYIESEQIYKYYNNYLNLYKDRQLNKQPRLRGYIYILGTDKENIYKVGLSKNNNKNYISCYECNYDKMIEKQLFHVLDIFKVDNNLYKISYNNLDNLIKMICLNNTNINNLINTFV